MRLNESLLQTRSALLNQRCEAGHWTGELSSSALATATAIVALRFYVAAAPIDHPTEISSIVKLIDAGRRWLIETQNDDGGWGDTTASLSNISTTALVWSALAGVPRNVLLEMTEATHSVRSSIARCEQWLVIHAGSLQPIQLASAIRHRYGRDHTFSVPILTTMALTGRLGPESDAWRLIPQLPFELAALPHSWFASVKLPVVSYALPALIAIGQVHHLKQPTRNFILRKIRDWAWHRTQKVLADIQPPGGGFLEATPLTSFVVLTLLGSNSTPKIVIDRGVKFLIESVREDGSWPIDTNLATWLTTLSVSAIDNINDVEVLDWLQRQQYRTEHPYSHAKPGGWSWTDLSGGVPDADDTSGALIALKRMNGDIDSARMGINWLLDLQNRDGGIPTFCRGWGTLPFDRSSTDITAHAIRAWLVWYDEVDGPCKRRIRHGVKRAMNFLRSQRRSNHTWVPLWFGNEQAIPEENVIYGTSRVLIALSRLLQSPLSSTVSSDEILATVDWMFQIQNTDGGWGADVNIPSSIEETGLAIEALCVAVSTLSHSDSGCNNLPRRTDAIRRGVDFLIHETRGGVHFPASPIGFYFAKLWYFERLYPIIYTMAALKQTSLFLSRTENKIGTESSKA